MLGVLVVVDVCETVSSAVLVDVGVGVCEFEEVADPVRDGVVVPVAVMAAVGLELGVSLAVGVEEEVPDHVNNVGVTVFVVDRDDVMVWDGV